MVNRVGVPSPEYVTSEGDIFNYLQKVRHCYFLNKSHDSNTPTSLHNNTNITMRVVPLALQIHQDLNKYHALIDF